MTLTVQLWIFGVIAAAMVTMGNLIFINSNRLTALEQQVIYVQTENSKLEADMREHRKLTEQQLKQ